VNSHEITRKDFLHRNLKKMREKHGLKDYNFTPQTWILPFDGNKLQKFSESHNASKSIIYIVKPAWLCQGKGIYLTADVQEVGSP
jgi:hypothetical protein